MDLREATREAEQLRWAMTTAELDARAGPLAEEQGALATRVALVVGQIRELPEPEQFGQELALLGEVDAVMREADTYLRIPETGEVTIAAETEAIELLLRSRRAGGGGGGGGGTTPGASMAGGEATLSALALVGRGVAPQAEVESRLVDQSIGEAALEYPAEFREGLDRYFGELDGGR